VLAVVVNFRTPEMTLRALQALLRELEAVPTARAVVVDNDSGDGSLERLAAGVRELGAEERISVLASGHNGGFGFGLNTAVRQALAGPDPPDAVYLLNSDAFPEPGALRELIAFQDAHPNAAIAGSYIHGPDGEPHTTLFRFPTLTGELVANLGLGIVSRLLGRFEVALPIPTAPQRVDWLAGASMLIRRDVFERIGLFDEGFFLYYEETDFCRRAADAGFETWYVPASSVAHVGGGSTGFKDVSRPRATYWFESRNRYFLRHHGRLYLVAANLSWMLTFAAWRTRRALQGKPDPDPPKLLRDFLRHALPPARVPGSDGTSP
jgi:GT2 family glycosyltransferase